MDKDRLNVIFEWLIKWCIYAIIFAAPFSKSISESSIGLAIALWLSKKVFINKDYSLAKTDMNIPFLIFIVAAILSLFNSAYPILSTRALFTKLLKFVVLYFIIIENIDSEAKLKDLLTIAFLSAIIITIDGFVQYYYSWSDGLHNYPSFKFRSHVDGAGFFRGFPTASFPYPNDLAAWILLVFFPTMSITIFSLKRSFYRYLTGLASAALFYLFFLTKARGAWFGSAVAISYMALSKNKIWLTLLIILILVVPFLLKMEMARYIFSFGSAEDRLSMWKTSLKIFKNHPVIGNGLNTFFVNFKKYREDEWRDKKGSYAHNCYLQMAADTGVVGLGAFLWLMVSYFSSVVKGLRRMEDQFYNSLLWGLSMGVFAFLIHSFFDTNLYSLNLATLFWTSLGVSQSIVKVAGKMT